MSLGLALPVPGPSASQLDTGRVVWGSRGLIQPRKQGCGRRVSQARNRMSDGPHETEQDVDGVTPAEDSHLETRSTKVWATAVTFS